MGVGWEGRWGELSAVQAAPHLEEATRHSLHLPHRCSSKFLEASALVRDKTVENAEQAKKILQSQQAILGKD